MIQNNMGYTYLYYGIAVEQFNGSDKTLNRYTEALAAIQDKLPETASIYHLPIPTHIGFLNEKIDISIKREDDFYNSSQKDFIEKLATTQKDKINVIYDLPSINKYKNLIKILVFKLLNYKKETIKNSLLFLYVINQKKCHKMNFFREYIYVEDATKCFLKTESIKIQYLLTFLEVTATERKIFLICTMHCRDQTTVWMM